MPGFDNELRLALALALNAWVLWSAHRFVARRVGGDWLSRWTDVLLLWFGVQYVSVGLPGLLGVLSFPAMMVAAMGLSGVMLFCGSRCLGGIRAPQSEAAAGDGGYYRCGYYRWERLVPVGCCFALIGFLAALAHVERFLPVLSNDGLIYHLPAAVQWMQTGRIGLYDAWFVNPANTYSPLAGSVLMCWWMLPVGNDSLVRFAQMPAAMLLFFAIVGIARAVGARTSVASLIACAAVLSRPIVSQTIIVKDDLFLAAFFACAVAGCARSKLLDPLGALRLAIAVGLFLATKYTALLAAPLLLLLIDAPVRARWGWRRWSLALAVIILIAGPWFLRNVILTGNPLYPVPVTMFGWNGLYVAERSTDMRSLAGVLRSLTQMYHSPTIPVLLVLVCGWLVALHVRMRTLVAEPVARMLVAGPVLGMILFAVFSHAAEIRYAFPALVLLFVCVGCALTWLPIAVQLVVGALVALLCVATGFESLWEVPHVPMFAAVSGALAIAIGSIPEAARGRVIRWVSGAAAVILAALIFVFWNSYLTDCRVARVPARASQYGQPLADLWEFTESLPTQSAIAYTGTALVHPLFGERLSHRVFHVPVRSGLRHYHDLPHSTQRLTDQELRRHFTQLLQRDADRAGWLARIEASGAHFVLIGRQADLPEGPEPGWAASEPRFQKKLDTSAGIIYQFNPR